LTYPRLSPATLSRASAGTRLPTYDRDRLRPGIVHLGLGAFFRAHGAIYTEDTYAHDAASWGILGVSLRQPDQRDRLGPQGGLYAASECESDAPVARVVGAVLGVQVAPEDPAAILAALADPATHIVSLTITEKGYGIDGATGRLALDAPDIRHDLANPDAPRTAIGFIVSAMDLRRRAGLPPLTTMSCDNLMGNGHVLAHLVGDFAAARDGALAAWIARNAAFPSTMVDRIVPATTEADIEAISARIGLRDSGPVVHERFRQWVVEDRFVDGRRPRWEIAGAEMVADVAAHETAKLRMLNGTHSALAYLGYLAGHETISATAADPAFRNYVRALWDEIRPMLPAPAGMDLADYARALLVRYANPAIRHRTWQIAMDGSLKLPVRLLPTIRERRAKNLPFPCLALALAAWIRYVGGVDEGGKAIDVRDPAAAELRRALDAAGEAPAARVRAVLGFASIFGDDLPADPVLVEAVVAAYAGLRRDGARECARRLASSTDGTGAAG
jgi:fructuronate reductase